MPYRHTLMDRVQFADTDMAGIVHFSNFFRYMERVEHDFFRSMGMSVWDGNNHAIAPENKVGWPRVHASCDYKAPLRFEEEFQMELLVEEIRAKTLRYRIRFWKTDGTLSAEGSVVAACVSKDPATGKMKAVAIPERVIQQISPAPAEEISLQGKV